MPSRETLRVIKKYPNRRLYDTQTSTYITVTDVKQLVLDSEQFRVVDAKTEEDLTRAILLQIILEEESGGKPIFSEITLSLIVRFYGHAMQGMMGSYLEKNMQAFLEIQDRLTAQQKTLFGDKKVAAGMPGMADGGAEVWSQFVNYQTPVIQNMMSNYLEQSKNMFVQMQEQFATQSETMSRNMFAGFPFSPGAAAPAPAPAPAAASRTDKKSK